MTRAELQSLDTFAQETFGRPVNPLQCACCGNAGSTEAPVSYGGLCPACQRKSRPDQTIIQLFRPLRMPKGQS